MAGRLQKFNLDPMKDRLHELVHEMNCSVIEIQKIMAEEYGVTINDVPFVSTFR